MLIIPNAPDLYHEIQIATTLTDLRKDGRSRKGRRANSSAIALTDFVNSTQLRCVLPTIDSETMADFFSSSVKLGAESILMTHQPVVSKSACYDD